MSYHDKVLICKQCGSNFTFTVAEQGFFAERGLNHAPSRCIECRHARKENATTKTYGIGERRLFPAVCAECGQDTTVPFQPKEGRPIFCRECYNRQNY